MKTKTTLLLSISALISVLVGAFALGAQQRDVIGTISKGEAAVIAVPDFRGTGDAQKYMQAFNDTLWDDLATSGVLKMAGKSVYPLITPQQPADFKPPTEIAATKKEPARTMSNGPWFTDWRNSPVNAAYLAFGYTFLQGDRFGVSGNLFNVSMNDTTSANVFSGTKLFFGTLNDAGARSAAHEYAAEILKQFGVKSLTGTKIFYISDRSGNPEVWSMDYDGTNQKQRTFNKSLTDDPAVSADGKLYAYATQTRKGWELRVHSVDGDNKRVYYTNGDSTAGTPEFSLDGKSMFFSKSVDGWLRICVSDIQGGNVKLLSRVRYIEVSPKINPTDPNDMIFISGRTGHHQLWRMKTDGSDAQMITNGDGDVDNPSWSPNAQFVAFSWNKGFEPGLGNIFVMDVAKKQPIQLTQGGSRNENPSWAPDGLHIVFSSKRGKDTQLYTMLADGTAVKKLTSQGNNIQPVWAKGLN